MIADWLARHGIASFRYDDRGVGESEGDFSTTTTFSLRDDAASAMAFAKSLNPGGRTGILGHSEGGTIAVLLAGDGGLGDEVKPDFVISMAGMVVPGMQTLLGQNRHSLEMNKEQLGLSNEDIDKSVRLVELIFKETARQWNSGVS